MSRDRRSRMGVGDRPVRGERAFRPLDRCATSRHWAAVSRDSASCANREVYHNNEECPEGKKIKDEHRKPGTDNRPPCKEC
jgi:hypothetical protein